MRWNFEGAVIDSKGSADKNTLRTGTLSWENIENKADYKSGGSGISYTAKLGGSVNKDTPSSKENSRYDKEPGTNTHNESDKVTRASDGNRIPLNERGILGVPSAATKGKADSTTRAAIAPGKIVITDTKNQKQDITGLDRNTRDSLNKLKAIFDKTKAEERKQLVEEMSIVGNEAIHELAARNGWGEGSIEKTALHGLLGAMTSKAAGSSALAGILSGGVQEYAMGYLHNHMPKGWAANHPDESQMIAAGLGMIVGSISNDKKIGGYIAQMGAKWNIAYVVETDMTDNDLYEKKIDEFQRYDSGISDEEYIDQLGKNGIKDESYYKKIAEFYPGGAGIALNMATMNDNEIEENYGNQLTRVGDRVFVINQDSELARTIKNSNGYAQAVGKAIQIVRDKKILNEYFNFSVNVNPSGAGEQILDNSSFLFAGKYEAIVRIMIDSDGVVHERICIIDNYNFEKHDLPNYVAKKIVMELNNEAALSMKAGYLKPYIWILNISRAFGKDGEYDEADD